MEIVNNVIAGDRAEEGQPEKPSQIKRFMTGVLMVVLPWLALIGVWYMLPATGIVSPTLVPSPIDVAKKLYELLVEKNFAIDIYMSTQRVLVGLVIGVLLAIPVAFGLGWYRPVRKLFDPLINFFRALPPIALIPLIIVYFGIDESAKIIMLVYAAFFSSVVVMYEGITQTNPVFVRVAKTLGATDREIFVRVIVPLALPHILTALRVALGVSWATLVASELVAAQRGLGAVIQNASNYFQIDVIYAGIITIGIMAVLMDYILRVIANRLVSWQDRISH